MPVTSQPALGEATHVPWRWPHPGTSTRARRPRRGRARAQLRWAPCPRPTARSARHSAASQKLADRRGRASGSSDRPCGRWYPRCAPMKRLAARRRAAMLAAACTPPRDSASPLLLLDACRLPGRGRGRALRQPRGVGGPRGEVRQAHPARQSPSIPAHGCARRSRSRSSCSPAAGAGRDLARRAGAAAVRAAERRARHRPHRPARHRQLAPARLRRRRRAALQSHVRGCVAANAWCSSASRASTRIRASTSTSIAVEDLRRALTAAWATTTREPLGRLLRHARGARVPAAPRIARAHAWCSTASRPRR